MLKDCTLPWWDKLLPTFTNDVNSTLRGTDKTETLSVIKPLDAFLMRQWFLIGSVSVLRNPLAVDISDLSFCAPFRHFPTKNRHICLFVLLFLTDVQHALCHAGYGTSGSKPDYPKGGGGVGALSSPESHFIAFQSAIYRDWILNVSHTRMQDTLCADTPTLSVHEYAAPTTRARSQPLHSTCDSGQYMVPFG